MKIYRIMRGDVNVIWLAIPTKFMMLKNVFEVDTDKYILQK